MLASLSKTVEAAQEVRAATAPWDVPEAPRSSLRALTSPQTDQIDAAICRLQQAVTNPFRNKTAKVRGQTEGGKSYEYEYRYADASSINDMLREPMCDNNLIYHAVPVHSKEHGWEMWAQVTHTISGQWKGCFWPLIPPGGKRQTQDFAGQTTYARRYAKNCLLDITPGDDDDANLADRVPATIADTTVDAMRQSYEDDYRRQRLMYEQLLVRARALANGANPEQAGESLLNLWQNEMATFAPFRDDPERRPAFDKLGAELRSAIGNAYGAPLGEVFWSAMLCRTAVDVKKLVRRFEAPEVGTPAKALKQRYPRVYGLFQSHMRFWSDRAKEDPGPSGLEEEMGALDDAFRPPAATQRVPAEPVVKAPPPMSPDASLEADASFLDQVVGAPADEPPQARQKPAFEACLRDETGDVCSDPYTDPLQWVRHYYQLWIVSDQVTQLLSHNTAEMRQIEAIPEAYALLNELMNSDPPEAEPPAPAKPPAPQPTELRQFVWPTRARSGGLDINGGLTALSNEMSMLGNLAAFDAWFAANEKVWTVEGFPSTARMKAEQIVMRRRGELVTQQIREARK